MSILKDFLSCKNQNETRIYSVDDCVEKRYVIKTQGFNGVEVNMPKTYNVGDNCPGRLDMLNDLACELLGYDYHKIITIPGFCYSTALFGVNKCYDDESCYQELLSNREDCLDKVTSAVSEEVACGEEFIDTVKTRLVKEFEYISGLINSWVEIDV